MTTARRARWSGVLVSSAGQAVLLRGTTGSVVVPEPEDATPAATSLFLLENGTDNILLENGTDQLLLEA